MVNLNKVILKEIEAIRKKGIKINIFTLVAYAVFSVFASLGFYDFSLVTNMLLILIALDTSYIYRHLTTESLFNLMKK